MSNIALREYHRNIERLIENHHIDDALSHCENIVRVFPKEIETYRKVGKVFLEKQDFANAEKVFNIILSVFPDDFVANVGLSFINEQNNRMDQAIQYMQCAFELQPANESLQDELKRLYNKRDHVEPSRIRLTRGALIKMYTRSDLFEQAIAEIRLGLHEKPGSIDYKLALADMLWKSGKNIDAVETCVDVISRLPYCWLANEILDKAFFELNQNETENHYRARLIELNPYYQYMLPTTRDVADIPDIAVQVENELTQTSAADAFDWQEFLTNTWSVIPNSESEPQATPAGELNWTSILDEAMQDDSTIAEVALSLESSEVDQPDPSANRRQAFIERLQKRSAAQESPELVPDWVLEESQLNQAESEDNFISIPMDPSVQEDINLPDIQDIQEESGIIDHDVPVEIPNEITENAASSQWVQDQPAAAAEDTPKPSLQDTQQIRINREETSDEKLEQARKALQGENIQFALKKIQELLGDDTHLSQIKDLLETASKTNPENANLWLTLGNIYQRLDMKEQALDVFIRAQKQISL
jgi:tetratricopeptide (TPR) repeat protein